MAKSKYEYVKGFELPDPVLPNVWMVVRLDGRGFHKFSTVHDFEKPNDQRALDVMNRCALEVVREFKEVVLAYGESDEYSFVFNKKSALFNRRSSKIVSSVTSYFSSCYVYYWHEYLPDSKLQYPPTFDGRLVCYPTDENLRDYLAWRQADCHINNLYNTCFWALVKSGLTATEAEDKLKGTVSGEKNELLFSQFGINYNTLSPMFRKGSTVIVKEVSEQHTKTITRKDGITQEVTYVRRQHVPTVIFDDIIGPEFWAAHPHILAGTGPGEGSA